MLYKFLIRRFIKNYNDTADKKVRETYAFLTSIIGIISNIILSIVKLSIGMITNSIAIVADAFNNISDIASSIITILSFRWASKPADEEHPFGHGRIEYIAAMVVSFMVILLGFEFIKSSFDRVLHPEKVVFKIVPFILILISMTFKLWLASLNKYVGNKINSSTIKASSFDALSDVFISGSVALSFILSLFIAFPLDGYIGFAISLFILYSGFSLVKETLSPLLGEAPDADLVKQIKSLVLSYEHISGVHDLIIHSYGPGKFMASIHAEVPSDISIVKIHDIIDKAEKEISEKLNILLVIHMDPINTNNEKVLQAKIELENIIKDYPVIKSIHDFRVIGDGECKTLVFDAVVKQNKNFTKEDGEVLKKSIQGKIERLHPCYTSVITLDKDNIHF
ncbi:MAG: cation diffusion facilitator family transporter [Bacillota bacterium]|nr:cation diffusion facilitator family transporter [Bacillota bacterium]